MVLEPPLLVFFLNMIFLFLAPCVVSYLAMRSYVLGGSSTILFLGCGALALGTGSLLADWLIGSPGPNVLVTVHNTAAFLASIFQAAAIVANARDKAPEPDRVRRRINLAAGYLGVLLFVALVAIAAVRGMTPLFFMEGTGPTPLRQAILMVAFLLFFISAAAMMTRFVEKKIGFLYWYALALGLLAVGMRGVLIQPEAASPIGWIARIAQYLAGIYFVIAVISARRDARAQGATVNVVIADIFSQSQREISTIIESMTDCHFTVDRG